MISSLSSSVRRDFWWTELILFSQDCALVDNASSSVRRVFWLAVGHILQSGQKPGGQQLIHLS
jgi:hypothetical protein